MSFSERFFCKLCDLEFELSFLSRSSKKGMPVCILCVGEIAFDRLLKQIKAAFLFIPSCLKAAALDVYEELHSLRDLWH